MAGTWEEGVHPGLYVCSMCDVCVVYVWLVQVGGGWGGDPWETLGTLYTFGVGFNKQSNTAPRPGPPQALALKLALRKPFQGLRPERQPAGPFEKRSIANSSPTESGLRARVRGACFRLVG